jgi:hypothetical protein
VPTVASPIAASCTAPLDNFTIAGSRLCWDDLWIDGGLDLPDHRLVGIER